MAKAIQFLAFISVTYGKQIGKNWVNLTVYRKTPLNYTHTVTNMNTGDAPGDLWFGLYTLARNVIEHERVPILNIPGYNVYSKYVISVDPRLGVYSECNPSPTTGVFACEPNGHLGCAANGDGNCWTDCKGYQKSLSAVCPASKCSCDFLSSYAVGMERTSSVFSSPLLKAQRLAKSEMPKKSLRGGFRFRKNTQGVEVGVDADGFRKKNTQGVAARVGSGQAGDYYDCAVAVQKVCGQYRFQDVEECISCAKANLHKSGSVIKKAGCSTMNIDKACGGSTQYDCENVLDKHDCEERKSTETGFQCVQRCSKISDITSSCNQEQINNACDYNPTQMCNTLGSQECPFWPHNTAEKCLSCMHKNTQIRNLCAQPYIDNFCGVRGGSQNQCNVQLTSLSKPCNGFGLPGLCVACVQSQKSVHNCTLPEVQSFCGYSPSSQCEKVVNLVRTEYCGLGESEYESRASSCLLCALDEDVSDTVFGTGKAQGGCSKSHSSSREYGDNSVWSACGVGDETDSRDALCQAVLLDTCTRFGDSSEDERSVNASNCLACASDPKNHARIFGDDSSQGLQGNCTQSAVLTACGVARVCPNTIERLCPGDGVECMTCALSAANHDPIFGPDILHGQANCTYEEVAAACDFEPLRQCQIAVENLCDTGDGYECYECANKKDHHSKIFGKNISKGEGDCTEQYVLDACNYSPERQCFDAINEVCITDDNSTKCVMCANLKKFHKQVFGHNITEGEGNCSQPLIYEACGLTQSKVCSANVRRLCYYDNTQGSRPPLDCVECVNALTGYEKEEVFGPDLLHGQGNCSEAQVESACGFEPPPVNPSQKVSWWTNTLGNRLNGSWYSTRSEGECNSTKNTDCWWTLVANPRNVNTTCVHERLLNVTYKLRPACFEACPEPKRSIYRTCPLSCMLETLAGNETAGWIGMTEDAIVKPFLDAFKDEDKGGCPEVIVA